MAAPGDSRETRAAPASPAASEPSPRAAARGASLPVAVPNAASPSSGGAAAAAAAAAASAPSLASPPLAQSGAFSLAADRILSDDLAAALGLADGLKASPVQLSPQHAADTAAARHHVRASQPGLSQPPPPLTPPPEGARPAARRRSQSVARVEDLDEEHIERVQQHLARYGEALRGEVAAFQTRMQELAAAEAKTKRANAAELETLLRFMQLEKLQAVQKRIHVQELLDDNQLALLRTSLIVIKEKLAAVAAAADDPIACSALDVGFFVKPIVLCRSNVEIQKLLRVRANLKAQFAEAEKEVAAAERASRRQSANRGAAVRSLVARFAEEFARDTTGKYQPVREVEHEFSRCILDEREKEGQFVHRWLVALGAERPDSAESPAAATAASPSAAASSSSSSSPSQPPSPLVNGASGAGGRNEFTTPASVLEHLSHLCGMIAANLAVPEADAPFLRLLVERTLFPRLWPLLLRQCEEELQEQERRLVAQLAWLRELSEEDFGIEPVFRTPPPPPPTPEQQQQQQQAAQREAPEALQPRPPPYPPPPPGRPGASPLAPRARQSSYREAMGVLEELGQLTSPLDMMQCLLACSRAIYRCAERNAATRLQSSVEMGADSFFPIFLFVIAHTRLPGVYRALFMTSRFISDADKMSEGGYYLISFESAVLYLAGVTPEQLRSVASAPPRPRPS